jgi:hypothetical protein
LRRTAIRSIKVPGVIDWRNIGLTILASVMLALALTSAAAAKPSFEGVAGDQLEPGFVWRAKTYAARCEDGFLDLRVHGSRGWRIKAAGRGWRRGGLRLHVRLDSGEATSIGFRRRDGGRRTFSVRCLPADFPRFEFERARGGGPRLFVIQMARKYAVIFNRNGAPVWWLKVDGSAGDAKLLPDGTISVNTGAGVVAGDFEILTLDGRLLRSVGNEDDTDVHDLQLLPNGNYLIGVQKFRTGVDATPYGGSPDGVVLDTVLRELTPGGGTVRSWDSGQHIGLAETGRWWEEEITNPDALWYDISHWNAVEVDGRYMYLSFRNTDAIYKVDRRTGEIVWKLGGTETPESLEVLGDPAPYPLGGQHDVRVQPNGTVTIFNNRTDLADATPRAQRFRINERKGTARLVETVTDPEITDAFCCGSARRMPSKDWLVSWGNNGMVGAYDRKGRVLYRLRTPGALTYRANPVPEDALGIRDLRRAMDRMSG